MNENKTTVVNNSIGFLGGLTIAFIVLKLIGAITWSWAWVLSPLWIALGIDVVITIIAIIIALIAVHREKHRKNRKKK